MGVGILASPGMMMRDALQELRSGKRFFAARGREPRGFGHRGARRSAVYGDARARARLGRVLRVLAERLTAALLVMVDRGQVLLRRFSVQSPHKRNRGLVLETPRTQKSAKLLMEPSIKCLGK